MAKNDVSVNASLDDDEDDLDGEGKSGGNGKKFLVLIIGLLLVAGGGAAAHFTGLLNFGESAVEDMEGEESEMGEKAEMKPATFLKIQDMIVNLSSDSAQPRYLRLSVQLELKSEEDKAKVEQVMPRVVDQFQTYLRELRVKDLRGSAGIYRLQMELLLRVNAAAYPVEVQDVLFQEILIQ